MIEQPERRERMARAAGTLGRPQAASEIADVCTELVTHRFGSQKGRDRGADFRPIRPDTTPPDAQRVP